MMTTIDALADLGVRHDLLTPRNRAQMQSGYLLIEGVLPRSVCDAMRVRLDELASIEGAEAGKDFHTEAGAARLGSLVNKDPMFDVCFLHPPALAAVAWFHQGREFGLSSLTSRTALPGQGLQALHTDFPLPSDRCAANALWLIDDFTPENGPTRLVPGSNQPPRSPFVEGQPNWKPTDAHPNEIKVIAPAGTLVVIDAFTWHGGTVNRTAIPRHLISAYFSERSHYQHFFDRHTIPAVQKRLSPSAMHILDHPISQ